MTLLTFPGGQAQKDALLAAIRADKKADRLIKGQYGPAKGEQFKGCAVGCTIRALGGDQFDNHSLYESLIGVPQEIAILEDDIFEGLPAEEAMEWPERFTAAIPVGVDLKPAYHRFMAWMLADPDEGCIRFAGEMGKPAIQAVADLHAQAAQGVAPTVEKWDAAWASVRAAAGNATWAVLWATTRNTTWAVLWATAGAAEYRSSADRLIKEMEGRRSNA